MDFNKAVGLQSDKSEGYACLGMALFDKGIYDEAFQQFSRAISIDPEP